MLARVGIVFEMGQQAGRGIRLVHSCRAQNQSIEPFVLIQVIQGAAQVFCSRARRIPPRALSRLWRRNSARTGSQVRVVASANGPMQKGRKTREVTVKTRHFSGFVAGISEPHRIMQRAGIGVAYYLRVAGGVVQIVDMGFHFVPNWQKKNRLFA